jgi:molybdopterin-containing oxidoreductase family iron-sulfur binding subunit
MENTRRDFLKITGAAAAAAAVAPVAGAAAATGADKPAAVTQKGPKARTATQWAMVIDTRKFHSVRDLEPLIEVCHKIHNVPHFTDKRHVIKWIWEDEFQHVFPTLSGEFTSDHLKHLPFLSLCNHCENPPCVRVCPTQATFKREDGIVLMDFHRCIGCRYCMAACPYGSRSFNFLDPRPHIEELNKLFPTRMRGVVEKCNFCAERLAAGLEPACVKASNGALAFGDLYDPESEVRKLLAENHTIRRKVGLGTSPAVYYIV